MVIEHDGKSYEIIFASDVIQDGVMLELCEVGDSGASPIILGVFRSDVTGRLTVYASVRDLPLEVLDLFLTHVHRELGPPSRDPQS
jgi:hypothetical protein